MGSVPGDELPEADDSLPEASFVALLRECRQLRERLDLLEYLAVRVVLDSGVSWSGVADELGVSRQAAQSRFSKPKPRRGG